MRTITFFGGGRITRILLNGFKNANVKFTEIKVVETDKNISAKLGSDFPEIKISESIQEPTGPAELIFVALHPPVIREFLQSANQFIAGDSVVISLAPKITIKNLQSLLSTNKNVIRMIPNAGSYVNRGYNPVSFATEVSDDTRKEVISLFENLGKVPVVDENQLEGYAMISAMGHTYFWFQLHQLKELAVEFGISENAANECISEMLLGTTETLFNSGLTNDQVIDGF